MTLNQVKKRHAAMLEQIGPASNKWTNAEADRAWLIEWVEKLLPILEADIESPGEFESEASKKARAFLRDITGAPP